MKNYRVTVSAVSLESIHYDVMYKTYSGAFLFGKKIANEAFYGEECEIKVDLVDVLKLEEHKKILAQKIEEEEIRIAKNNFRALNVA